MKSSLPSYKLKGMHASGSFDCVIPNDNVSYHIIYKNQINYCCIFVLILNNYFLATTYT